MLSKVLDAAVLITSSESKCVDIEGDGDTGGADGDVHVLASVVTADNWRRCEAGHSD